MLRRQIFQGGITSPKGFKAGAVAAGIKAKGGLDLALLYSETPCQAAGLFTTNRIKAAPVVVSRRYLRRGKVQALIVNSGCANAMTGRQGLRDAQEMASVAARKLGLSPHQVLVASTGVIGQFLPLEQIGGGIDRISLSGEGGGGLAQAIMTTDTFPKEMAVEVGGFRIGGAAKGAGMIHPDLATMLAFLTTDAQVEAEFLKKSLRQAVGLSFNMITVDGDTSPNDMVLLLANGLSGVKVDEGSPQARAFQEALEQVCLYLAQSIARDGEGASRLVEVRVGGAANYKQARRAARTIAGSPLVKAAVYGADPNWGRVVAALGRSGAKVREDRLDLYLDSLCLVKDGIPLCFDPEQARCLLSRKEVLLRLNLNLGPGSATAWGCDLTPEYVTINSAYTT